MAEDSSLLHQPLPERAPRQGETGESGSRTYGVLIVEDTVDLATIVRLTLERLGFRVWHATHGDQAMELFHAQHPDVVLLDLALPDIPGWRLLEEMRRVPHDGAGPAYVVITAYGDPANRLMGKLQGVDGYLLKPFKLADIENAVMSVLRLQV
jgi:DNA-binding response OmpR family regulator